MAAGIPLGPFEVLEPLGRGGMGQVWRAQHRVTGTPAAIKIITGTAATEATTVRRFRNEVRAVARLDHPGIIMVLDYGVVDDMASAATEGLLVEGSPYLAMEMASGGSLSDLGAQPLRWSDIKAVLLGLLDALAHAHARGVIHRDLKPGNVVLCTSDDVRPGLKLSDFGIATAVEWRARSGSIKTVAGTLHYIAPEQLLGNWRDFGPWTDLYALGCMAYKMATGELPFAGRRGATLMRAQLFENPPPLQSRVPVPEGFAEWVARLMQKQLHARFQRAADAAWSLQCLGDVSDGDEPSVLERGLAGRQTTLDVPVGEVTTLMLMTMPTMVDEDLELPEPIAIEPPEDTDRVPIVDGPPPLPETWRHPLPPAPPLQLQGAGLGLFGLRDVPMVGRESQRDRIWQALLRVARGDGPEALVIHGPQGTGKRRLSSWIEHRAQEMGAVTVLRAVPAPEDDPTTPLRDMVVRFLRAGGLTREGVEERVEDKLAAHGVADPASVQELTELVHRATDRERRDNPRIPLLESAEDRYAVVRSFVRQLARRRPVMMVLDDVHDCTDLLGLTAHLMRERDDGGRIVVLLTVRDDVLAERVSVSARMGGLVRMEGVQRVEVGPLGPTDHAAFLKALLPMDRALAAQVEERTRGNPLFAARLLGHWIERDLLTVGPTGFRLATSPRDAPLPAAEVAVWNGKVERVVRGLGADCRVWLERAAALGVVDQQEWVEVCPSARPGELTALRERLVEASLAHQHGPGWTFAHPMMQECLEHSARRGGRWAGHHRACAAMLASRQDEPGVSERYGRHLLEAGDFAGALNPLLAGVRDRRMRLGLRPALALLATTEEAMKEHKLGRSDVRWGLAWVMRGQLLSEQMAFAAALRCLRVAVDDARRHAWEDVLPEAMYQRSLTLIQGRQLEDAERSIAELGEWVERVGRLEWRPRWLLLAGELAGHARDFERAGELLDQAEKALEEAGDELGLADAWRIRATWSELAGVAEQALFERALEVYERHDRVWEQAVCRNGLAEVARGRGDLKAAEAGYLTSLRLYESVGRAAVVPTINLGLVCLKRGRFLEARRAGEHAQRALQGGGRRGWLAISLAMVLPCTAAMGDWAGWDHYMRRVLDLLGDGFLDADLAWSLHLAGRLARENGQPDRAQRAYRIARSQWVGLGDLERIREVEAVLARV